MVLLLDNALISSFLLQLLIVVIVATSTYFITIFLTRKKIKISINYEDSFWTTFEEKNYVVFNISIINNNEFDLNSLTFNTFPSHNLLDNIWSEPNVSTDRCFISVSGASAQIVNSFENTPISVTCRNRKIGNLVFKSDFPNCHISKLIARYQDKEICINVKTEQIRKQNI